MEEFFYGMAWGSDLRIPADRIMISAASFWNPKRNRFDMPNIHSTPKKIIVDSGGFICQQKWDDFPYSVGTYTDFCNDFIAEHPQTTAVAVMDLPCEPDVNRAAFFLEYREDKSDDKEH